MGDFINFLFDRYDRSVVVVVMERRRSKLHRHYYDPKRVGSYGGVAALRRVVPAERDVERERHANVLGSFVGCARLLHRRFEAWFRIALRLFEHRRTAHRRRQDCTTATNSADNRTTRGNGGGAFRSRPVHARAESRI